MGWPDSIASRIPPGQGCRAQALLRQWVLGVWGRGVVVLLDRLVGLSAGSRDSLVAFSLLNRAILVPDALRTRTS